MSYRVILGLGGRGLPCHWVEAIFSVLWDWRPLAESNLCYQ